MMVCLWEEGAGVIMLEEYELLTGAVQLSTLNGCRFWHEWCMLIILTFSSVKMARGAQRLMRNAINDA